MSDKLLEKAIRNESKYAYKRPGDMAIRVICGNTSVAIEISDYEDGKIAGNTKVVYLAPEQAKGIAENILDSVRRLMQ